MLTFTQNLTQNALQEAYNLRQSETRAKQNNRIQMKAQGSQQMQDDSESEDDPDTADGNMLARLPELMAQPAFQKGVDAKTKLYGLSIMWEIAQDKNGHSYAIIENALNSLANLLSNYFAKRLQIPFLLECVQNLQKNVSVPQSLFLAMSIINCFSQNKIYNSVT